MLSKLHLNPWPHDKQQGSTRSQTGGVWGNLGINVMVLVYILTYFIKENNAVGLFCVVLLVVFFLRVESYFIPIFLPEEDSL